MSDGDKGQGVLPLGLSYSIGQYWLHERAPANDGVYPGTQAGKPPAYYEALIRSLHPDAALWGPSQINKIFSYLSDNTPIPVDAEVTLNFSGGWPADKRVIRERHVYWLGCDGDTKIPENWKLALSMAGYSTPLAGTPDEQEAGGHWEGARVNAISWAPVVGSVAANVWFQSGAGLTFSFTATVFEWIGERWRAILAVVAVAAGILSVAASLVVAVLTFGAASPAVAASLALTGTLITSAIALVGAVAATLPQLIDAAEGGDTSGILVALAALGASFAVFSKAALAKMEKSDPAAFAKLSKLADSVGAIYRKGEVLATEAAKKLGQAYQGVEPSLANMVELAHKYSAVLPFDVVHLKADARDMVGSAGRFFWDRAEGLVSGEKIPTVELANYAATVVPWYAQGAMRLHAMVRGVEEAPDVQAQALRDARAAASMARVPMALQKQTVILRDFDRFPLPKLTVEPAASATSADTNGPIVVDGQTSGGGAGGSGTLALFAAAGVGAYLLTRKA